MKNKNLGPLIGGALGAGALYLLFTRWGRPAKTHAAETTTTTTAETAPASSITMPLESLPLLSLADEDEEEEEEAALPDPAGITPDTDSRTYAEIFPGARLSTGAELLGSAIRSAAETAPDDVRQALGWVFRNATILEAVPIDEYAKPGRMAGEYQVFSTIAPGHERDVSMAAGVLAARQSADQARGAQRFLPVAEIQLLHSRAPETNPSLQESREALTSEGYRHVRTVGTGQHTYELYRFGV